MTKEIHIFCLIVFTMSIVIACSSGENLDDKIEKKRFLKKLLPSAYLEALESIDPKESFKKLFEHTLHEGSLAKNVARSDNIFPKSFRSHPYEETDTLRDIYITDISWNGLTKEEFAEGKSLILSMEWLAKEGMGEYVLEHLNKRAKDPKANESDFAIFLELKSNSLEVMQNWRNAPNPVYRFLYMYSSIPRNYDSDTAKMDAYNEILARDEQSIFYTTALGRAFSLLTNGARLDLSNNKQIIESLKIKAVAAIEEFKKREVAHQPFDWTSRYHAKEGEEPPLYKTPADLANHILEELEKISLPPDQNPGQQSSTDGRDLSLNVTSLELLV